MDNNNITIIEISADAIYLVAVGDKKSMDKLACDLNKKSTGNISYITQKLDVPIASKCADLIDSLNTNVSADAGVEIAQCYTYADGHDCKNYMLMELHDIGNKKEYKVTYPKLMLENDCDPEKVILNWFKKNLSDIPKGIKKTLVPITLVGANDEILVFSAKIRYPLSK